MNMRELKQLSETELKQRLSDMDRAYYQWKHGVMLGKERNHAKLCQMRSDIARIQTILRVYKK